MGVIPRRLMPVFRDRDELPSAANLGDAINASLQDSRFQLVICSPRSAQSKWVNAEVRYFKSLGRESRVLCLIVDGEPGDAERECFPETLRHALEADGSLGAEVEVIAADARPTGDGRDNARLKLIAGMLGVGFDELKQREKQRQFWQRVQQVAVALLVTASLLGAWQWFEHYKQAQALQQRIETVYEHGRLALLDQQMGPAAVYLAEAYRLGRDTPALRFMLARTLETVSAIQRFEQGPAGSIQRAAFSPDGQQIIVPVVGEENTIALLRDAKSGAVMHQLNGLPAYPHLIRYLPDARVLVSGYASSSFHQQQGAETGIWDTHTGERVLTLLGHSGHFGAPLSGDGRLLVTAGADGDAGVHLHDARTGKLLRTLSHRPAATAASISADARWVMTGDVDGVVRLWDAATGRVQRVLTGRTPTAIVGVLPTPDGRRVVALSRKGDVRVWGLSGGELQLAFSADKSYVADVRFDASGQRMLTIGRQGYKVWDLERGTLLFARDIALDWRSGGDLDATGQFLAVATTDDAPAELWDVQSRRLISRIEFAPQAVTSAVFNAEGSALLLGGESGATATVSPLPGRLLHLSQPPALYGAGFTAQGERVATVGWDRTMRLWDSHSGEPLATGIGHTERVLQLLASQDGERLVTVSDDATLKLWSSTDGKLLQSTPWSGYPPRVQLSPDDAQLLTTSYDQDTDQHGATLWDAKTLSLQHRLEAQALVRAGSFSPDHQTVAIGTDKGELMLWSRSSGALLARHQLGDSPLIGLRYSADGQRLLVVDLVHGAQVFDIQTARVVSRLELPKGNAPVSVEALAISPDGGQWALATQSGQQWVQPVAGGDWQAIAPEGGRLFALRYLQPGLLITSGWDALIRVWDTDRRQSLGVLGAHDQTAWSMDIDASRERLLTASLDGSARIWRVGSQLPDSQTLSTQLNCRLPLRLSPTLELTRVEPAPCQ